MALFPLHHSVYQSYLDLMDEARTLNGSEARAFAREMRAEKFENAWQAVREHCQGDVGKLCGVELYNETIQQWATILVDPTDPSVFRAQYYADNGFHGHACFNSTVETLDELIHSGFHQLDNGALVRLSATSTWQLGCEITSILQQINSGMLSFEEGEKRYQALLSRRSHLQESRCVA